MLLLFIGPADVQIEGEFVKSLSDKRLMACDSFFNENQIGLFIFLVRDMELRCRPNQPHAIARLR
jgi:hypothetical protein